MLIEILKWVFGILAGGGLALIIYLGWIAYKIKDLEDL